MEHRPSGRKPRARRDGLKVWVKSLGCPKNTVDTEKLVGQLGAGVRPVADARNADLLFVNTCGFIEPAVKESVRSILDLAGEIQGRKKKPLLAVAGCMVGRYGRDELAREIPEVDVWLTPDQREQWGELLLAALDRPYRPELRRLSTPPSYAYLKISEGCRHRCAFCTIPSIRGPLRSSPREELLAEAGSLAGQGVKELVLIAQDLTDYGQDLGLDRTVFPDLLRSLGDVEGLRWLRMLYLYPRGITPELLAAVREVDALLPYFDMPLQHSHPDILKNMGRPFAVEPERVCGQIREAIPDAALRTTLIVGYPGETDEHFRHLCDFVEKMRFTQLGVFTFWPEEGTVAAGLPDQVEAHVKEERRDILMELQQEISRDILEEQVGSTQDVLVDTVNPEWPGLHNGRVWFQAPDVDGMCYISGPDVAPGAMVQADIVESSEYDLTGLAVERQQD
ncbi:MAG: 30S ribosomal protein S12 methylthiotransferase RimO [Desulfovibrionaceae bacterium]|nr:30S ribosomal protein S12 methylthiotransferase RimO [Desulfovibrionaceae bacterium]